MCAIVSMGLLLMVWGTVLPFLGMPDVPGQFDIPDAVFAVGYVYCMAGIVHWLITVRRHGDEKSKAPGEKVE